MPGPVDMLSSSGLSAHANLRAVELKLSGSTFPPLPEIVEGLFGRVVGTGNVLQRGENRDHDRLGVLICVGFVDRCQDPGWDMLEEECSWERVIASTGPDGPGGEVVTVGLGKEDDVEFRHKELSVHCLVLVFFFAALLLFDLRGLSFNLNGLSLSNHQMIWRGNGSVCDS